MPWILLIIAGLAEVGWTIGMKYSDGFTKLIPSIITIVFAWISFYLLSLAMKDIPLSTSYPVWVGIGAVGAVIAGVVLFGETLTIIKIICLTMIVAGIVGLKMAT